MPCHEIGIKGKALLNLLRKVKTEFKLSRVGHARSSLWKIALLNSSEHNEVMRQTSLLKSARESGKMERLFLYGPLENRRGMGVV